MNAKLSPTGHLRAGKRLAALGAAFLPAVAMAEGDNWIELMTGGVAVDGNAAAANHRLGNGGDFFGGISSFHFEQIGDKGVFLVDGHALPGSEDYDVDVSYTLDEVGYVRAGFRQFRTWYDRSGGYIPGRTGAAGWWDAISPVDDELHIDRGSLWFEAGLRVPDIPEITFGYEHEWRDGYKDSTFWQRANDAAPNHVYPGTYRIDEVRDIFRLDIRHVIGNTEFGGGLRYHSVRNDDTHHTRYGGGGGATLTQRDVNEYDLWGGHLYSTSSFCDDKLRTSFAYNLTTINSDIGGFRTVNHTYTNLLGGALSTTQVLNASLWWNPAPDLVVVPSFRYEWWQQEMWGSHLDPATIFDLSDYESGQATFETEVRYSGIDNLLVYGKAQYSTANGDLFRSTYDNGVVDGVRMTDSDTDIQKYVVGANWYPFMGVTVATQAYWREYDQGFSHRLAGSEDAQLIGHRAETADANIRVTWRVLPRLTFVTRYDYQQTDIENQALAGAGITAPIQSADITKHILTESISWTPIERLYLQVGIHWISSETDTPANLALPGVVTDWDNDYWSLSWNGGYAFSEKTQLNWGYYYYHADNYGAATMPYGSISDEHQLTVGVDHQLTENVLMNVRYGYFKGDDAAAGGFNDYEAHVVSTGVRFRF